MKHKKTSLILISLALLQLAALPTVSCFNNWLEVLESGSSETDERRDTFASRGGGGLSADPDIARITARNNSRAATTVASVAASTNSITTVLHSARLPVAKSDRTPASSQVRYESPRAPPAFSSI
ncbi:MAG: hypothetical protein U5N86_06700 [Planctomycetota bacterium]|nr:hypothetical protein [Planctomycetota bacterium]